VALTLYFKGIDGSVRWFILSFQPILVGSVAEPELEPEPEP